ncbi:bifunctional 23S rRNA (guanine(2069)-N(7))-methyltransferase RlmK/23S rRNA (guanine(2445)-N(2))-methyltransferase RlmL [Candidatus Sororendozoicomonas aggregata]|uniref:bifunctional 23S rRNA (guanine(2069)-N(7))-methyltransferase RlmK/23S rRNA (guanine(2445)-N(2))-methyltransferase RlmL n=1 Tax=Candidatus Sororendozoicomonas aggregata TaxID=3073239 RepID=UPI002ED68C37
MRSESLSLFASCPKGLETLLATELDQLGAEAVQETVAGVSFNGNMLMAYRACLWSRLASRILLRLDKLASETKEQLYDGISLIDWSEHLDPSVSFRVDFSGSTPDIQHTRFGAQVVKDAIVDQCRDQHGFRPSVNAAKPDLRINVHAKGQSTYLSIDLSGQALHQRGYRLEAGEAPLKENLAAAILLRARWPAIAKEGGTLVDPLCGSGTLLIEGAMMAADIAPGLLRARFGFDKWLGHIPKLWLQELEQARERRKVGLGRGLPAIIGYEGVPKIVGRARANAERAGLGRYVSIKQQELARLTISGIKPGLVLSNPPYGERMGDEASLVYFYRHLGNKLKSQCARWQVGIFSSTPELCRSMGLTPRKQYSLFNGALPCKLYLYDIREKQIDQSLSASASEKKLGIFSGSPGAQMFANRLSKNFRLMGKWARKQGIECYRLYDADMPEYAIAIDCYKDWAHVQEYAAPTSVDPDKARKRLLEALEVIPAVLDIPEDQVVFKRRQRQTGTQQYTRQSKTGDMLEIKECECRLLVNLKDYLDTGLFLDHRLMRQRIAREAKGKDFLNLFCYTATASVHAGVGGAQSTTSVDMSNTYLAWGRKNFALNGLSDRRHRLEQANCLEWLKADNNQYDMIFMDPPTFSNSKRMRGTFDVQNDHVELINLTMTRLRKNGVLYFSNNYRGFSLDDQLQACFTIKEITASTIDKDFQRRQGIHRSWVITHQ